MDKHRGPITNFPPMLDWRSAFAELMALNSVIRLLAYQDPDLYEKMNFNKLIDTKFSYKDICNIYIAVLKYGVSFESLYKDAHGELEDW